jgi:hypothetical protein
VCRSWFRWNCAALLRHCFGVCSKTEAANQHAGSVRKRPEEQPAWDENEVGQLKQDYSYLGR